MKTISAFILFVMLTISYQCSLHSDSQKKQEHTVAYNDSIINAYTAILKQNPNSAETYYKRGMAYCTKHDYDKAKADFYKVIEMKPEDTNTYKERLEQYFAEKKIY